ncbi:MAG: type II toxin-antitoxin system HicA family toxin [Chloroflexi bacterium]|nr:type II toxin-antitoxin system HicA family toxin [Chloroflexota bacterium]MBI3741383.1 type II toxin-antitoxin system HicA family toxin [Chloroflexota bacterium]
MPRLRRLSGDQVIRILEGFEFAVAAQSGSHVKLRRITATGEKQTLTIPRHKEIDTGTLRAIFRQASRYVSSEDLQPHFYTN